MLPIFPWHNASLADSSILHSEDKWDFYEDFQLTPVDLLY